MKKGLVEFFVKRFKGEEEIKRKEKEWREKYKKKYGRWPDEDGACFIIKKLGSRDPYFFIILG